VRHPYGQVHQGRAPWFISVHPRVPARAILCACVGARRAAGGKMGSQRFRGVRRILRSNIRYPGATAGAVLYAVEAGWVKLEGAHSVCLTEEGRRLIAKEAN
jgi:hypothetical protein